MRLFIALNLPKKERDRIHRAARPLRERELPVRWTGPEHYHLTLKFLGEVRTSMQERVEETLARVAEVTPPIELRLGGFGAFPTIRRPRVLWTGVEASPELRCLKQDLEWGLAEHGFPRETRAFHPHLTLGRARAEDGAGAFRGLDELVAGLQYQGSVVVRGVDLMRSQVSAGGSRYSLIRTTKLTGST
jgi:RNA 2',3'-cyclic 3'-phosphodiesterase